MELSVIVYCPSLEAYLNVVRSTATNHMLRYAVGQPLVFTMKHIADDRYTFIHAGGSISSAVSTCNAVSGQMLTAGGVVPKEFNIKKAIGDTSIPFVFGDDVVISDADNNIWGLCHVDERGFVGDAVFAAPTTTGVTTFQIYEVGMSISPGACTYSQSKKLYECPGVNILCAGEDACPMDRWCISGTCSAAEPECILDEDCKGLQTCEDNVCTGAECGKTDDCEAGFECTADGECSRITCIEVNGDCSEKGCCDDLFCGVLKKCKKKSWIWVYVGIGAGVLFFLLLVLLIILYFVFRKKKPVADELMT